MKRIIIKLSGEGLSNKDKDLRLDFDILDQVASQIKTIVDGGTQVGIIVGGGNFWRGAPAVANGVPRHRADYVGMLGTVMNAMVLQSVLEKNGMKSRVQSALKIDEKVVENYVVENAINYLNEGQVVIFAGGTGRPFFTTDTTATLVASEIGATTILMGKNGVSGVYDADPATNPDAKHFEEITYTELLERGLKVMDSTAASMARDNGIELTVFDITEEDALVKAVDGNIKHTKVRKG